MQPDYEDIYSRIGLSSQQKQLRDFRDKEEEKNAKPTRD